MIARRSELGYTLIELVISMGIAALLLTGLQQLLGNGMAEMELVDERTDLARQARFAMARMVDSVRNTDHLMIPLGAKVINNSGQTPEETSRIILDTVRERLGNAS